MFLSYYVTRYRKRGDNFSRHLLFSTKREDIILQQQFQQAADHSGQERGEKFFTGKDKSVIKPINFQISEILLPGNIQTTQYMTFFERQKL